MAKTVAPSVEDQPAVRMKATRARQGFLDRDILLVLVVSTALAVLVLFVALALNSERVSPVSPSSSSPTSVAKGLVPEGG